MRKQIKIVAGAIIVVAFVVFGIGVVLNKENEIKLKSIELKSTSSELDELETRYDLLNKNLEKANQEKASSAEDLQKLQDEKSELEKKKQELESQLQAKLNAKKEQERLASASNLLNVVTNTKTASASSGSCNDYMAQAGITHPIAVDLINRENRGCDPCVYNNGTATGGRDCNYSGGNAYGIPQALPGNKMASMGADWKTNPVTQLRWMQWYVMDRYKSWEAAKAHHDAMGWY